VRTSDPAASSVLRLGGRPVPVAGMPLRIDEATPLAFALGPDVVARLTLAGLPVPLVDGRADTAWVDESRREQWVGELDLELVMSQPAAMVIRPKVVVLPRRATIEGFAFLVDQFRSWAGPGALADPAGRARIWAELAPRVPKRDEERALVALALLRRAIPALVAIHRAPATTPAERREWCTIDRTAGRRLLLRRLHPFDPPRPIHEPRSGQVATIVVEPSTDTPENRFVAWVVRRLVAHCREAATTPQWLDGDQVRELNEATRALAGLAAVARSARRGDAAGQLPAAGPAPLPGHADGGRRHRRQPPMEPAARRSRRPRPANANPQRPLRGVGLTGRAGGRPPASRTGRSPRCAAAPWWGGRGRGSPGQGAGLFRPGLPQARNGASR
jgi:hypothetical protein